MAARYSGSLKLAITLDSTDTYSVTLCNGIYLKRLRGIRLAPAMAARVALDSAEAYDEVARVAVSFAAHEDGTDAIYGHIDCDEVGEAVIRRRKAR